MGTGSLDLYLRFIWKCWSSHFSNAVVTPSVCSSKSSCIYRLSHTVCLRVFASVYCLFQIGRRYYLLKKRPWTWKIRRRYHRFFYLVYPYICILLKIVCSFFIPSVLLFLLLSKSLWHFENLEKGNIGNKDPKQIQKLFLFFWKFTDNASSRTKSKYKTLSYWVGIFNFGYWLEDQTFIFDRATSTQKQQNMSVCKKIILQISAIWNHDNTNYLSMMPKTI